MKISRILSIAFLGSMPLLVAAQVSSIRCDFSHGIPADFLLYDLDGKAASSDLSQYDFADGSTWIPYYVSRENNNVAASTSFFETEGTANDWMVLPKLKVESPQAMVSWRSRSTHARYRDGLKVYISDKGNNPADFTASDLVLNIPAEQNEWTRHSISLANYVGKEVYIAFVNNSNNCNVLYVDDIFAGNPSTVRLESTTMPLINPLHTVTVSGTATTDLDSPVTGFTIGYQIGEFSSSVDFPNVTLNPGMPYEFSIPTEVNVPAGQTVECVMWIEHNGERESLVEPIESHVPIMVAEELTGSWCGWCVRGVVAMSEMKANYPDSFIGIAVHGNDFLEVPEYRSYIQSISGATGYPSSITNRNRSLVFDPEYFPDCYDYLLADSIKAVIQVNASLVDGQSQIISQTRFAQNDNTNRYRVSYIFVENDVYEPDNENYCQHNSYAGGEAGEMAGFENLPEWIEDWHFEDVARGIVGDPTGIENSIPATIFAGTTYDHSVTAALPSTILNSGNVEVVALVLDTRTKHIVAAAKSKLASQVLRGDVDMDGNVAISDVTSLIDYLLSGDSAAIDVNAADCDEDGIVSISDVTALIDYLLANHW